MITQKQLQEQRTCLSQQQFVVVQWLVRGGANAVDLWLKFLRWFDSATLLLARCQTDNIQYNTIQYNNSICRALFTKRPGALTETSDDMLCEIVQSLTGA